MNEEDIKYLEKLFEKIENDEEWFSSHFEELKERYSESFLCIKDQEIIAEDKKLENLLSKLERKGVDISSVFVTSIPPKGVASIL